MKSPLPIVLGILAMAVAPLPATLDIEGRTLASGNMAEPDNLFPPL